MEAFISYSHANTYYLDQLHTHLATLRRDNLITAWTDNKINPGANIDSSVSKALKSCELFTALLSPEYLASEYCYSEEFEKALKRHKQDELLIVPIIVEPCDWMNTPFKNFKALPQDGKPISNWANSNTAFLNVIQGLRMLLPSSAPGESEKRVIEPLGISRNYKVQKDFDKIDRSNFKDSTFNEIKALMSQFLEEVSTLENVKSKIIQSSNSIFEGTIVNRNKIATECTATISIDKSRSKNIIMYERSDNLIHCSFDYSDHHNEQLTFILRNDQYRMYWSQADTFGRQEQEGEAKLLSKQIADLIWDRWLEYVHIT